MARPRDLPDASELKKMLDRGMTQAAIAELYGVTKQAVSFHVRRLNLAEAPPRYDSIPWVVAPGHQASYALRMLRLWGARSSGMKMTEQDEKALERYVKRLDEAGAVVDYTFESGAYWTPRREVDEGIVRNPRV